MPPEAEKRLVKDHTKGSLTVSVPLDAHHPQFSLHIPLSTCESISRIVRSVSGRAVLVGLSSLDMLPSLQI